MNGLAWMIKLLREQLAEGQPVMHILTYRHKQRINVRKDANRANQQRHRNLAYLELAGPEAIIVESPKVDAPDAEPFEKLVNLDWQGD